MKKPLTDLLYEMTQDEFIELGKNIDYELESFRGIIERCKKG